MSRRYLITGGAGFIGSNFIRHVFESEPDAVVTNLDAMTYAGVRATVAELDADHRHTFVEGDIRDPLLTSQRRATSIARSPARRPSPKPTSSAQAS